MSGIGKNKIMRSPEDKEKIVKRYLNGESAVKLASEIDSTDKMIREWTNKYLRKGLEGLKSKTGKSNTGRKKMHFKKPKNRIEELELELMKKEIEIARLKKGYVVKGVGAEKEFVTIFDKNTK